MQLTTILLLLVITIFLILILHTDETYSLYPYTIRGFVTDVRSHPFRFIGGLFFKKAFLLKKLKLKWKLKKKFVLKKLLKKLFLGTAGKLEQSPKLKTKTSVRQQILAQYYRRIRKGYNRGNFGEINRPIPPHLVYYQNHPQNYQPYEISYHRHHHYHLHDGAALRQGRKRRAIIFPDENGNRKSGSSGSSSANDTPFPSQYEHDYQQQRFSGSSSSSGSPSGRTFFDDESFHEFQSIGLGQNELEMLKQLPENLQFEYKQEMQELETSASEPREADIMEYLTVTNEFDSDHCIAKGICEVMARGNRTSNQFENFLLDYYNEEPETRKDPNGVAAYVYDYAAFLGKSRRDSRACASYFPKCPESTNQLTSFMNDIFSSEMCDPPVRNEL